MSAPEESACDTETKRSPEILALHDRLRNIQEPKGYFFNRDMEMTFDLLEQLLETKRRYSYMACPCRLANGTFGQDKDIICPCRYREEDVREFGACFCELYVSGEWNEGSIPHVYVPDRRPPEKIKGLRMTVEEQPGLTDQRRLQRRARATSAS